MFSNSNSQFIRFQRSAWICIVFLLPLLLKKPASQKYDVAYGINTRKTLVQVSGYSCFTKVQNSGRDDGENFSLYVEF